MLTFDTDTLINTLKVKGSIPTRQELFSNDDFCTLMQDAQQLYIIPSILRSREEFFVSTYETALVAGQSEYRLPSRAIGMKVRQVILLDAAANEVRLPRIEPENKVWHENYAWWPGTKSGYYFEANRVILTPNLSSSYTTLRIKYFRRPNKLIATSAAGKIIAVNYGNGTLTLDKTITTFAVGSRVDLIAATPPFDSVADDFALTNANPNDNTVQVSVDVATELTAGDWVCFAGESPIPQYPEELHPILVQYALSIALKSMGDASGAEMAIDELNRISNEQSLGILIGNRDEGSPRKIVNRRGIFDTGGI